MKVLLLEFNEVTWHLIDPLMVARELPTFARLVRDGMSATTINADEPQPPEILHARRVWDIAGNAGRRVGVYGSLHAWPPHPVRGFIVPDSFAPSPETYPPSLQVVQEMNLRFRDGSPRAAVAAGARLLRLGLRPATIARVVAQLVRERLAPRSAWRRVCLHPLLNFDVFRRLYRRYRPHFATFHTNHVAHYQHLYSRAMEPGVAHAPRPADVEAYAGAIAHAYRVADRLLKQALRLVDRDTMLVVASGTGQYHPKAVDRHPEGMVMFYGRGVRPGRLEEPISTLDLAPTMLRLLRLPVPPAMTGRDVIAAARKTAQRQAIEGRQM